MFRFVVRRILLMIPVLLGVLLIVFCMTRISGDPVAAILGTNSNEESYNAVYLDLGLDKSLPEQFLNYVKDIVTKFDLGADYQNKKPVRDEIFERLPTSLALAFISLIISVIIGIPLGVISAVKRGKILDYGVTVVSMIGAAMPSFWVALMLIIVFSSKLQWFPASGLATWDAWVLPSVALGLLPVATICRTTRSNMLESLSQDYIRTSRAKGSPEKTVIYKHALKNSIIPTLTVIGVIIGMNIGNSVVLETVFTIPGIGTLMMNAINTSNYPVIQGSVLVLSFIVCVLNLVVDIAYGYVDPRIKAQYIHSSSNRKKQKKTTANTEKEGAI